MQATTMSESQFKRRHIIALDRKNVEEKGVLQTVIYDVVLYCVSVSI